MCLGMNPDILQPGERCASTSNRNFEGRQGRGGRTHLVSPEMAAAAAIAGHFVDVRELIGVEPDEAVRPHHGPRGRPRPADVDTDQIIPKQFLKRIERTGWADGLFFDWRKDPDFELNNPAYAGREDPARRAELRLRLLARARALGAAGVGLRGHRRVVVRGHLRLELRQDRPRADRPAPRGGATAHGSRRSRARIGDDGRPRAADDHGRRRGASPSRSIPSQRHRLLNGLDDIGLSLQHEAEIAAFEAAHPGRVDTLALQPEAACGESLSEPSRALNGPQQRVKTASI